MDTIRFSQELCEIGADVEILSFARILLKRFEYCQQFKPPVDPKVSYLSIKNFGIFFQFNLLL